MIFFKWLNKKLIESVLDRTDLFSAGQVLEELCGVIVVALSDLVSDITKCLKNRPGFRSVSAEIEVLNYGEVSDCPGNETGGEKGFAGAYGSVSVLSPSIALY